MKKLLFVMAIGAALAWLWDPDNGASRRAMVRGRLEEKGLLSGGGSSMTPPPTTDIPAEAPAAVAAIR